MKRVMVTYKVHADQSGENQTYVKKVYEELQANSPAGLRYATFLQEDGLTFVHVAEISTADGSNPLSETPAFKAFQAGIKERCEIPPTAIEIEEVGSYNFFAN